MNSELKPKIRFKGFTDDWEQRKLISLSKNVGTGKSKYMISNFNKYAILGSRGVIGYDNNYDYSGDFILTARVGEYAGELYRYKGNVKITDNTVFIQGDNLDYLYYLLKQYDLKKLSFGSGQPLVKASELSNIELSVTLNNDEKNIISSLFLKVDNLITLHQRKCDKLVELKKSLLEKMFPQNNSVIPEIRFKGFTDDWEQRKLEDFGSFTGGTSIESEFEENGKYKVISIGSYSETSKYNDQGIRCRLSEKTINKILNKDDLTMILNDKTSSGNIIGRVLIIDKSGEYVYNQRTERIEPNIQKYYPQFLYHMLNAPNIRKKIIKQSQGNTQIFVNWTGIQKLEYLVPKMDEQINLAKLIGNLDNLITLHQRKHEKLNKIKQSLLNDMFV